jgi:hypothetical protein
MFAVHESRNTDSGRNSKMKHETPMNAIALQRRYFALIEDIFNAITGQSPQVVIADGVTAVDYFRALIIDRVRHHSDAFAREVNDSSDRLTDFLQENRGALFNAAKSLGGVKLVLGGGSGFGVTQQSAVRKMLLYCDTVLIPDPIARFFERNRLDQAIHLQIALDAYQLFQLRPLILAELPSPPVFIFPSLERALEDDDAVTRSGIEHLLAAVVNANCGLSLATFDEIFEYAKSHEREFLAGAASGHLLIAPGGDVASAGDPEKTIQEYLKGLEGRRDPKYLDSLRKAPTGLVGALLLSERLARQFHLLDNSRAFAAQPMLTVAAQWHYYEMAARAEVEELVREKIMSPGAFTTLRAIQDPNLKWLGDIPSEVIAELLRRGENREFRRRLKQFTEQLHSVSSQDLEATTKEVMFGVNALIAEHQKEILDIQDRYAPKYKNILLTGIVSAASFLPALAPILTPVVPVVVAGSTAASYMRDKWQERAEKQKARTSLLGVLAAAAPKRT